MLCAVPPIAPSAITRGICQYHSPQSKTQGLQIGLHTRKLLSDRTLLREHTSAVACHLVALCGLHCKITVSIVLTASGISLHGAIPRLTVCFTPSCRLSVMSCAPFVALLAPCSIDLAE